jgi:two-component system NtrC family response regulator
MRSILLCDDDVTTRSMFRDYFEPKGYDIFEAGDGAEALDSIAENSIDMVVSDIHMKPTDGITLLTRLREDKNDVPFILITGMPDIETYIHGIHKLGAFEYMQKPIDLEILNNIVEKMLEQNKGTHR